MKRKEKKGNRKEKRGGQELFSQGQSWTCLAGCAGQDFCSCKVQLEADLRLGL
jgi:hypothetical protein